MLMFTRFSCALSHVLQMQFLLESLVLTRVEPPSHVLQMQFQLESLHNLDASLRKLGSRLIVVHGCPVEGLARVMDEWDISRLAYEVQFDSLTWSALSPM